MVLAYVVMECLPGNPVPIIGSLQGEEQTLKIIEYGLQLLKVFFAGRVAPLELITYNAGVLSNGKTRNC